MFQSNAERSLISIARYSLGWKRTRQVNTAKVLLIRDLHASYGLDYNLHQITAERAGAVAFNLFCAATHYSNPL